MEVPHPGKKRPHPAARRAPPSSPAQSSSPVLVGIMTDSIPCCYITRGASLANDSAWSCDGPPCPPGILIGSTDDGALRPEVGYPPGDTRGVRALAWPGNRAQPRGAGRDRISRLWDCRGPV